MPRAKSKKTITSELLNASLNLIVNYPPPYFNSNLFFINLSSGRWDEATTMLTSYMEGKQ